MTPPPGLTLVTVVALSVVGGLYALDPSAWPGRTGALVQAGLLLANLVLTTLSPRFKCAVVRGVQRFGLNPATRGLLALGLNHLPIRRVCS